MENRSTSVYLYVALGVVVVLACLSMFGSSSDPISNWFPEDVPSYDSSSSLEVNRSGNSSRSQLALVTRNQQIARLNGLLDQKNDDLDDIMQQLSKMKARLKDSQEFVDELLGQNLNPGSRKSGKTKQAPNRTETVSEQETENPNSVEELRNQLQRAQEEMSDLQEEAEQEIADLEDEKQAVLSAAADVLVGLGSAAVSGLVDSLSDNDPEIRAWSAYVLGRIGGDASDAVSALEDALSDSDETVREYAQQALDAIE